MSTYDDKGKLCTNRVVLLIEVFMNIFHKKYCITGIEKLAFCLDHVKILGK